MSHTTAIKAIKIVSIPALRAAVQELNKEGKRLTLIECPNNPQSPRAYFSGQEGLGPAPYVIRVEDARYDIGIYPAEGGGYEARTDFWGGSVEKVVGVQACSATSKEQARLGSLFQMYAIHATMEQARKKGYSARRITGKDGAVQIEMTGM